MEEANESWITCPSATEGQIIDFHFGCAHFPLTHILGGVSARSACHLQLTWAGLSGSVQSEFPTTLAFAAALVLKVWNYVVVVRYYPRAVEAVDWEQVVEASPIGPRMGVAPGLSRLETAR